MKVDQYPNTKIHQLIMDTFLGLTELDLELVDVEILENKALETKSWNYVFCKSGSQVKVEFSLLFPSPYACALLISCDPKRYFSLNDYLTSIKNEELKRMHEFYNKVEDPDLRDVFLFEYLDLAKKYLATDLKKVARGEEWINVPFDWGKYGK